MDGVDWRTSRYIHSRLFLLMSMCLACALLSLATTSGEGSPDPPSAGDWNIGPGEVVHQRDSQLYLTGDLNVEGNLTLVNCTLVIGSGPDGSRALRVHPGGVLSCIDTDFVPANVTTRYALRADAGSILNIEGCSFSGAGWHDSDRENAGVLLGTDVDIIDTTFVQCYIGLWASAAQVSTSGCDFIACTVGTVVSGGGKLRMVNGTLYQCSIGVIEDDATLALEGVAFDSCPEAVICQGGSVSAEGATFTAFDIAGLSAYCSTVVMEGCVFIDAEGEGVYVHSSRASIASSTFTNCSVDIDATCSDIRVDGTVHRNTLDEAIKVYRSRMDINGSVIQGSYWGVRSYHSSGVCRNLTVVNATFAVYIERSGGLLLQTLVIDGGLDPPSRTNPVGLRITRSDVVVRDAKVFNTRVGMYLEDVSGLIERVHVEDCSREGLFMSLCTDLTVRNVTVVEAMDGFRFNLFSSVRVEDCLAHRCQVTGYNFTAGDRSHLIRCNASANPLGMRVFFSSPRIEDCVWYMRDDSGRPTEGAVGLSSIMGSPRIHGGTLTGGGHGMDFEQSSAIVSNVTFTGVQRWCVGFMSSWSDRLEGCRVLGDRNGTGVVVLDSSPVIRDNVLHGMLNGILVLEGSDPLIEDNLILNMTWDGIHVISQNGTRATLEGNDVRDCGSNALQVGPFGSVVSRRDVLADSGQANVLVLFNSYLDIQGATVSGSSIGLEGTHALGIRVSFCSFQDNNRGIYVKVDPEGPNRAGGGDVVLDSCYFFNHSSYCAGVRDGRLTVLNCTFLDNIAAIQVWNSTVELVDSSMVGSWLFGLRLVDSEARWRVNGLCRIVSSDLSGPVRFIVDGGTFVLEESEVALAGESAFLATNGASVRIRNTVWVANGSVFRVSNSTLDLGGDLFEGVGPPVGGSQDRIGVTLTDTVAECVNTTFRRSRGGLSLVRCDVDLHRCTVRECVEHGIFAEGTDLTMDLCRVDRIVQGGGVVLYDSNLLAEGTAVVYSMTCLYLSGGSAKLVNCTLGGGMSFDAHVNRGSLVLVNTTHGPDKVLVEAGGNLQTWWFVFASVLCGNESDLSDAEVWVEDPDGGLVARSGVDEDGRARAFLILARNETDGVRTVLGPHLVSAEIQGFRTLVSVQLNGSVEVELLLLDMEPPIIEVRSPAGGSAFTKNETFDIYGIATDSGTGIDRVEARMGPTTLMSEGDVFLFSIKSSDGMGIVEIRAFDRAGNVANATVTIHFETRPIGLVVTDPPEGLLTNARNVTVRGTVGRDDTVMLFVGRHLVRTDGLSFEHVVDLVEGPNTIAITATDDYGHSVLWTVNVTTDWTPPELNISLPPLVETTRDWVPLTGWTEAGCVVMVDGARVVLRDGQFEIRYPVGQDESMITVRAVDRVGNERARTVLVYHVDEGPAGEQPIPWYVLPFILGVPILAVVVWYAMNREIEGGGTG